MKNINIELWAEASITAAAGDEKGPPRFEATAYTGQQMRPHCTPPLEHPVIIDLAGMETKRQRIPVLRDHKTDQVIGHTEKIENSGADLKASGFISGAGPAATEVAAAAKNGFVWGVSVGATLGKVELLKHGQSARVNNQNVKGPVYLARASRLREISMLAMPADDLASASIAAEAAESGEVMDFATWLKANGFQPEKQNSAGNLIVLRAQFKACGGKKLEGDTLTNLQATLDAIEEPEATVKAGAGDDTLAGDGNADAVVELKAQFARLERRQAVYNLCGEHADIAAKAMEKSWDDDTIKLAIKAADLEKSLPHGIQIRGSKAKDAPADGVVIEAACAIAGGLHDIEKKFDEKTLNEAHTRFPRKIGLQEAFLTAAWANGYTGHTMRGREREVFEYSMKAAQFSTVSLPGIFANTANKFLLEGFTFVDSAWRMLIAGVRTVNDFKTITSYRLTGQGMFEEIGPGGEIPHGSLGEENFTNRARSYGKMYGITFQDIRNDDMNVLTALPRKLGRGSALKLNAVFWAAFLDNATFFADPSENYLKGATTNLSATGLQAALLKFRSKTEPAAEGDAADTPLAIEPRILLVPPALEITGATLMAATLFNTGGAATDTQVPNVNPWAGRFRVLTTPYLLGQTATTYYLLADPRDIPTMEVVALDGKIEPTVETADADFNTLGVLMRGTSHWGVAKQDARGGLKVKGAA